MMVRALISSALLFGQAHAVIIDRIAIVLGNSIVKDSDIDRDIRITDFLNSQPLEINSTTRKASANRLVDQIFIRREIDLGDYPTASLQEADRQLAGLESEKYGGDMQFENGLRKYGLTGPDLRFYFQWQLTILRFVDLRFKPAVVVTDQQVTQYFQENRTALERAHPGKASLEELRHEIEDTLSAKQVDKLFFEWLDQQRKDSTIRYLEESLR